ncbi:hypothetical protein [Ruminiclostridium josui]|uniref:hypothetical protein n=1 Tax=Ruminiclostridium josui TaxID=1499 RepID=UPI0004635CC0|nr:hypothetical protein [Ruminiclostridium josui]
MKKKLLIIISIIVWAIVGTGLYGHSFFNVRFNFYNSSHAIYTKTDVFTRESKLKGKTLSKSENGIWISEPIYFKNTHQLHFAMINSEADDMFRIKVVLTSESGKTMKKDFNIFAGPSFFMFKSYQMYFELPEIVLGEKYTIEISKNEQIQGKVKFSFK